MSARKASYSRAIALDAHQMEVDGDRKPSLSTPWGKEIEEEPRLNSGLDGSLRRIQSANWFTGTIRATIHGGCVSSNVATEFGGARQLHVIGFHGQDNISVCCRELPLLQEQRIYLRGPEEARGDPLFPKMTWLMFVFGCVLCSPVHSLRKTLLWQRVEHR
ncbi:uncharacterized protein BJX67DRAFT_138267 [Aspergillus lucknowensis]|uniref:Uncharacterized protein n=1 Tax=Aspergillus lucknowensis TaxID=176173 RepID=A0ABR4LPE5_9EURO